MSVTKICNLGASVMHRDQTTITISSIANGYWSYTLIGPYVRGDRQYEKKMCVQMGNSKCKTKSIFWLQKIVNHLQGGDIFIKWALANYSSCIVLVWTFIFYFCSLYIQKETPITLWTTSVWVFDSLFLLVTWVTSFWALLILNLLFYPPPTYYSLILPCFLIFIL